MFKIVAIQTLPTPENKYNETKWMKDDERLRLAIRKSCHDSVMKVLHENVIYWLVKGYAFKEGKLMRIDNVLPDDFFSEKAPYISVSAIVGENGMGKSSLLELLFRIVNNISYALREGLEVQKDSLHFVRDIYARVWIEENKVFYCIEQTDSILKIHYQDGQEDFLYDYEDSRNTTLTAQTAKDKLRELFYTIVVNYSQYAYNTNDYMMEWDMPTKESKGGDSLCWLSSLFHKNDAYQTPIVLNPFREEGNININRERYLTQTRLYNLVLNEASPLKRILRKKDVKSFIFDVEDDLNPIPGKRYYSKKVVRQMMQMQLLQSAHGGYKTVNDIGRRITAAWGHVLGYEIEQRKGNNYWESMDDVRTINYIVYKTLKISGTYAKYYKYYDCFGSTKKVQEYVAVLKKDYSHITLKIRRCLAFLFFHHYGTGCIKNGKVIGNSLTVAEFKAAIDKCLAESDLLFTKALNERYTTYYFGNEIETPIWAEDELMPAPSFKTDILLADESDDNVRFSSLSSGEKQMIYSVSTVIYQLLNINSAWMSVDILKNVQYRNVCLVLDEIELCAHPKFQLMLINMLIDSIKSLGLTHVLSVNIILATHSPFVLSDIPSSNILCMEDGKPKDVFEKDNESFCANVYDILNNQFFMNRFVGDFANKKLEELIGVVNQRNIDTSERIRLMKEVEKIGDTYIRKLILKKLTEKND